MKLKQFVFVSLITLSSINVFAQAKKTKSPIDGRIYTITLTEEGKKKADPIKDEASFLAGKFKSNYLVQAEFMQTDYDYEIDSTSGKPVYKFTVEAKTDNNERFSWEGTVDGDDVSGTAIIRKKGKIQHSYTFTGTQKNKKKVKPAPKVAPVKAPASDTTKSE
jgi:hypothetical protein